MPESLVVRSIPEGVTPNMLSWGRIVVVPMIWVSYLFNPLIALFLYVLACYTDWVDGKLARERGMSTASGKRLDEVADKFLVVSVFLVLFVDEVILFDLQSRMFWASVTIITRDLILSAMRSYWEERAAKVPSLFLAKLKTFSLMPSLGFLLYSGGGYAYAEMAYKVGEVLLVVALACAVISLFQYIYLFYKEG